MATRTTRGTPKGQSAYQQLYRTFTALDRAHERWLTAAGSNGARFAVLAALDESDHPLTPSEVSEGTGRSPNAISPLLRALQQEGLIRRNPNATDRRSHYLSLTAAGRRLVKRLQREERSFMQATLSGRSVRELTALERSLLALEERAGTLQRTR